MSDNPFKKFLSFVVEVFREVKGEVLDIACDERVIELPIGIDPSTEAYFVVENEESYDMYKNDPHNNPSHIADMGALRVSGNLVYTITPKTEKNRELITSKAAEFNQRLNDMNETVH